MCEYTEPGKFKPFAQVHRKQELVKRGIQILVRWSLKCVGAFHEWWGICECLWKDDNVHCVLLSLSVKRIQPRIVKASKGIISRESLSAIFYTSFWFCHKIETVICLVIIVQLNLLVQLNFWKRGAFKGWKCGICGHGLHIFPLLPFMPLGRRVALECFQLINKVGPQFPFTYHYSVNLPSLGST